MKKSSWHARAYRWFGNICFLDERFFSKGLPRDTCDYAWGWVGRVAFSLYFLYGIFSIIVMFTWRITNHSVLGYNGHIETLYHLTIVFVGAITFCVLAALAIVYTVIGIVLCVMYIGSKIKWKSPSLPSIGLEDWIAALKKKHCKPINWE